MAQDQLILVQQYSIMELTVGKHYKLTKRLNSGSFGEIYIGINLKNNRQVAVKLEPIKAKHPQLQYEAKLLAYILGSKEKAEGFPSLYYFGKEQNYSIMIIDLLGASLQDLFQKLDKRFDLKTTVMIGLQLVDRFEHMHTHKFIHRDIKPENFLLGTYENCGKIYMIDFGLSKKYIQKDGSHIPYKDNKSLTGTPRYASINSHLGIEQSRRDDLQSMMYMLIYFLKGSLPWQNLKNDGNYARYEKILQKKLSISVQTLTSGLPKEFGQLLNYAKNLHFMQDPNYSIFRKLFEQALLNEGIQLTGGQFFCWEEDDMMSKKSKKEENNDEDFFFDQF